MRLFAIELSLCTSLFLLATIMRMAEPATNKTESLQDLSARFVRALAQGDVAACQACGSAAWLRVSKDVSISRR